jgi:hypothetical protein
MWMAKLLLLESTEIQMTGSQIRMTNYNASGTIVFVVGYGLADLGARRKKMSGTNSRYCVS